MKEAKKITIGILVIEIALAIQNIIQLDNLNNILALTKLKYIITITLIVYIVLYLESKNQKQPKIQRYKKKQ